MLQIIAKVKGLVGIDRVSCACTYVLRFLSWGSEHVQIQYG